MAMKSYSNAIKQAHDLTKDRIVTRFGWLTKEVIIVSHETQENN